MRISRISTFKVFTCVGLFFFVLVFFLFSFFLFTNIPKMEGKSPGSRTYQYQEINSRSSSIDNIFGFATLNKALSEDEFISYSSSNGNQIIISNFGSTQYKCEGSCTCTPKQRRFSNSISRPLFLIFSALSSTMALKIAEKSFHDQCILQFSSDDEDECTSENILSSVDLCKEIYDEDVIPIEGEYADYSCEGHCISNKKLRSRDGLEAQEEYTNKIGGCESLKTSGDIRIRRSRDREGKQLKGMHFKAQAQFVKKYLTFFCKHSSKSEYYYTQHSRGYQYKRLKKAFMCVSGGISKDFPDDRLDYPYQNIKCVMNAGNRIIKRV